MEKSDEPKLTERMAPGTGVVLGVLVGSIFWAIVAILVIIISSS